MPVPVFELSSDAKPKPSQPEEEKISGGAAFFAIVFVIMLAITVELALLDVNRVFNPQFTECRTRGNVVERIFETSPTTDACNIQEYEAARLLLHADIIIPLALISVLVIVILNMQKRSLIGRIFKVSLFIFVSWISVRILYEGLAYSLKHHALYGKYFVLFTAIAAASAMIIWLQRTLQSKKEQEKK